MKNDCIMKMIIFGVLQEITQRMVGHTHICYFCLYSDKGLKKKTQAHKSLFVFSGIDKTISAKLF